MKKLTPEIARQFLLGADLDQEEERKLRRRVEDCLRKNPDVLYEVASILAASGDIKIQDLI